jgi:hypothetical protein
MEKKNDDLVQSSKKVKNKLLPFILIALSVKISYFFDREKSLNFPEDPVFTKVKLFVQNDLKEILGLVGILGLMVIENYYIIPKYQLDFTTSIGSNLISLALLANHYFSGVTGPVLDFGQE